MSIDTDTDAAPSHPYAYFQPYDILQILSHSWQWQDFSTLRNQSDGEMAIKIVNTKGQCSNFEYAEYRIVGLSEHKPGRWVKYYRLQPE